MHGPETPLAGEAEIETALGRVFAHVQPGQLQLGDIVVLGTGHDGARLAVQGTPLLAHGLFTRQGRPIGDVTLVDARTGEEFHDTEGVVLKALGEAAAKVALPPLSTEEIQGAGAYLRRDADGAALRAMVDLDKARKAFAAANRVQPINRGTLPPVAWVKTPYGTVVVEPWKRLVSVTAGDDVSDPMNAVGDVEPRRVRLAAACILGGRPGEPDHIGEPEWTRFWLFDPTTGERVSSEGYGTFERDIKVAVEKLIADDPEFFQEGLLNGRAHETFALKGKVAEAEAELGRRLRIRTAARAHAEAGAGAFDPHAAVPPEDLKRKLTGKGYFHIPRDLRDAFSPLELAEETEPAAKVLWDTMPAERLRHEYMNGMCWVLAHALHRATGLQTVGVYLGEAGRGPPTHVGVVAEDGTYADARGTGLSEAEFLSPYLSVGRDANVAPIPPMEVRRLFWADPLHFEWAERHVDRLFPDLDAWLRGTEPTDGDDLTP